MGGLRGGGVEMEGVVIEGEVVLNNETFVDGVHLIQWRRVLLITSAAACASSLGLAPLLLMRKAPSRLSLGRMLAAGCGLLAAACAVLLLSAAQKSKPAAGAGFVCGAALLTLAKRLLHRGGDAGELRDELWDGSEPSPLSSSQLLPLQGGGGGSGGVSGGGGGGGGSASAAPCSSAATAAALPMAQQPLGRVGEKHTQPGARGGRKTALLLGVMALYAVVEGIGIGVSFGGGEDLGDTVTLAVALCNLPEGLLIGLLLVPRLGRCRALACAVGVHLGQPAAATAAFLFEKRFVRLLPGSLGLAAGAVAAMVLDIAAEAVRALPRGHGPGGASASRAAKMQAAAIMATSAALMLLFELQFHVWQGQEIHIKVAGLSDWG